MLPPLNRRQGAILGHFAESVLGGERRKNPADVSRVNAAVSMLSAIAKLSMEMDQYPASEMQWSPSGQKWHPWASGNELSSLLINTKKTEEVECPAFEQGMQLRTADLRELDSKVEIHLSPR